MYHAHTITSRDSDNGQRKNVTSFRSQVGPSILLTGIFSINFLSRIILSPLMPTIEKDLGLGHSEAGTLFLLISAGYFISLMGAGFLSSRLMHRNTIILSAMAVGIALLAISSTSSLMGIRFGLLILGMAAGLYLPSGIATLTSLISSRHWGKGLAIHELAPNLSFVAAPLASEALLQWFSWRGILALIGAASMAVGIGFACFGKGGNFPGEAPSFPSFRTLLAQPAFWIITMLFSLAISASLGVYAMLPLYLVAERGTDRHWANTLVALSRVSGLGMAFLAGWATDRLGSRRIMAGVFLLTGLTTVLLGAVPGSWIVIVVFLQPMLAVCFFPAGFAALSSIVSSGTRNVAVSLTVPVAFLMGGGAIPAGIGIMGDAGSFALGIALVGGLILTGFVLSLYLKLPGVVQKSHVVET
jgi:NNP family nitrate/nitrite transporter-like MFS transporter